MVTIPEFRAERIDPVLNVSDIARSVAFYVELLGFTAAPWGDEDFSCVGRDGGTIYLCRGGQGSSGTWIWIGVDGDVDRVFEFLTSRGVRVVMPPTNFPWAYEFRIYDPDGHVLRFGAEPREDLPFFSLK